jgi:hypothetical protein
MFVGSVFFCVFLTGCIGELFAENEPRPQITYGEFPFTLVYELHGEEHTIENVMIAEFRGFLRDPGETIRRRAWRSRLKYSQGLSGYDTEIIVFQDEEIRLTIAVPGGGAFLGESRSTVGEPQTHILRTSKYSDSFFVISRTTQFELFKYHIEKHGFRLINFEIAPPIVNTFR